MLGQDNRELVTGTIKCIFADPEDYATRLLRAYSAGDFTDRFECHIRLDGRRQERWLEHWSQPIRQGLYAGGRIEQYTDITDRKKAEFAEIEQRRFAEALRSTAEALTSTLDLDDVLDRMLETIDTVVPNDAQSTPSSRTMRPISCLLKMMICELLALTAKNGWALANWLTSNPTCGVKGFLKLFGLIVNR